MTFITHACARHVLLALLLAAAPASVAQLGTPPRGALTADELTRQVLDANLSLAAQRAVVDGLRSGAEAADALDDPRLSVGVAPNTIGSPLDTRGQVQISQALPWPGKRALRSSVATARARSGAAEQAALARNLEMQSRAMWARWWYLHEALAANGGERELVADLLPVVETQYAAGSGRQQDVLRVQARMLHLDHQRLELDLQREQLAAHINALRGRPASRTLAPPAAMPASPDLPSMQALAAAMRAQHPALAGIDAALGGAQAQIELANKDSKPDFRLYTGYLGALDPAGKRWQIGAEINVPIGRARRRAARTVAARELDRLRAERDERELDLLARLNAALASSDSAQRTLALYREQILPLARQSLAAARADFESGRGEFSNVIDAESALLDAQLTVARAQADRYAAAAEIASLTGTALGVGASAAGGAL